MQRKWGFETASYEVEDFKRPFKQRVMKVERFKRGFKHRVMKIEHLKLQFGGAGHRETKKHLAKWGFKHRVRKVEHVQLQFGGATHRFIGRVAALTTLDGEGLTGRCVGRTASPREPEG